MLFLLIVVNVDVDNMSDAVFAVLLLLPPLLLSPYCYSCCRCCYRYCFVVVAAVDVAVGVVVVALVVLVVLVVCNMQ